MACMEEVISYVMFGVWLGGLSLGVSKFDNHPLDPWTEVGSSAYVQVVNSSYDSVRVTAKAPEVDSTIRTLGTVPPWTTALYHLPYLDTKVTLTVGAKVVVIHPNRPRVYTFHASN
jgi:hypothetical protein